jgi:hypothetical protein
MKNNKLTYGKIKDNRINMSKKKQKLIEIRGVGF